MLRLINCTALATLVIVCMTLCFIQNASSDSGAEYSIIRTTLPPKIDGKLDDTVWKYAEPAELALTNNGTKVTKESLAYGVYDDSFLYFGFHRFDKDLNKLLTNAKTRDGNVWEDDEFELFLDTSHDHTTYWQICINTANVIWDCQNPGGGCGGGANIDWETATTIGAKEDWFAEIKISYKELDVETAPKPGDVWGVNFCGHVLSGVDEWVTWSDIGASFHVPTGFGNMIFSNKAAAVEPTGKISILWGQIKEK